MSTSYIVRPGDTLSSVARRHGCSLSVLQSSNGIADPRRLQVGTSLTLPSTREQAHTHRPVDTSMAPTARVVPASRGASTDDSSSWTASIWKEVTDGENAMYLTGVRLGHGLSDRVLQWWREVESGEAVHTKATTKTEQRKPGEQKRPTVDVKAPSTGKKHKDEVIAQLHERLFATPQVVQTAGVRLSRNERRMIVAAVGLCEIDNDVFGSRNTDQEFAGRKFGKRGSETSYSRIVHIGLSYGYIQYSQDGGGLGKALSRMRKENLPVFERFFPNHQQLIEMTTTGLPEPRYNRYGKSGQAYWNSLPIKDKVALKGRADTDANGDKIADQPLTADEQIRGARVQRIAYVAGYPAIDLWEDYQERPKLGDGLADHRGYLAAFKAAGDVPAFQDVQIELAVEDYMNPVLAHCSQWNIRSGIGLAFVVACSVRGGAGSKLSHLLSRVATAKLKLNEKFDSSKQERECVQAIANAAPVSVLKHGRTVTHHEVDGVAFDLDEKRRAALLLKDEYHFLKEDLYDTGTYDAANDS